MTKLTNSNSDQNPKSQIVTKLKKNNCGKTKKNSIRDKTHKPMILQNSKTQIVTKPKNSNCDKTKKKLKY